MARPNQTLPHVQIECKDQLIAFPRRVSLCCCGHVHDDYLKAKLFELTLNGCFSAAKVRGMQGMAGELIAMSGTHNCLGVVQVPVQRQEVSSRWTETIFGEECITTEPVEFLDRFADRGGISD